MNFRLAFDNGYLVLYWTDSSGVEKSVRVQYPRDSSTINVQSRSLLVPLIPDFDYDKDEPIPSSYNIPLTKFPDRDDDADSNPVESYLYKTDDGFSINDEDLNDNDRKRFPIPPQENEELLYTVWRDLNFIYVNVSYLQRGLIYRNKTINNLDIPLNADLNDVDFSKWSGEWVKILDLRSSNSPDVDINFNDLVGVINLNQISNNLITKAKLSSTLQKELLPPGGSTNEILEKKSDSDFDVRWVTKPTGTQRAIATQTEAEAGTDNAKGMTPLRTKEAISALGTKINIADASEIKTGTDNKKVISPKSFADYEKAKRVLLSTNTISVKSNPVSSSLLEIGYSDLNQQFFAVEGDVQFGETIPSNFSCVLVSVDSSNMLNFVGFPNITVTKKGTNSSSHYDLGDILVVKRTGATTITVEKKGNTVRALATQAEAEAGTDNAKGMTPLRTKQAISALVPPSTARALATQAEAEAGTDNTKSMSPLRTKQAISALAPASGEQESVSDEFLKFIEAKNNALTLTEDVVNEINSGNQYSIQNFHLDNESDAAQVARLEQYVKGKKLINIILKIGNTQFPFVMAETFTPVSSRELYLSLLTDTNSSPLTFPNNTYINWGASVYQASNISDKDGVSKGAVIFNGKTFYVWQYLFRYTSSSNIDSPKSLWIREPSTLKIEKILFINDIIPPFIPATKADAERGTNTTNAMTPVRTRDAIKYLQKYIIGASSSLADARIGTSKPSVRNTLSLTYEETHGATLVYDINADDIAFHDVPPKGWWCKIIFNKTVDKNSSFMAGSGSLSVTLQNISRAVGDISIIKAVSATSIVEQNLNLGSIARRNEGTSENQVPILGLGGKFSGSIMPVRTKEYFAGKDQSEDTALFTVSSRSSFFNLNLCTDYGLANQITQAQGAELYKAIAAGNFQIYYVLISKTRGFASGNSAGRTLINKTISTGGYNPFPIVPDATNYGSEFNVIESSFDFLNLNSEADAGTRYEPVRNNNGTFNISRSEIVFEFFAKYATTGIYMLNQMSLYPADSFPKNWKEFRVGIRTFNY